MDTAHFYLSFYYHINAEADVGVTSAMASFSWATYPDTLIISILSLRGSGMVSVTLAVQINKTFIGADRDGRGL